MRLCSISVYETASHFYIIGSDAAEAKFSVLKVDRTAERDFVVGEPDHEYSKADVAELLSTISSSSIVTQSDTYYGAQRSGHNTLVQTINKAYGLIGAIRFLEGYYLLIVTKARVVATLGHHAIYKIEDVSMIYIPSTGASTNQDEQRYARLFQSVDLTTNFYFSYTYDLSHTLQENTLAMKNLSWNKNSYSKNLSSEQKFVWNNYLLQPFRENLVSDKWTFEIVHGYIGQQIIELPCSKLALMLIARRSSVYAGTRFLKRGTNFIGAVANDVETEQIVWDMFSSPRFDSGKFTSFVQRRGSVPLFWSQDPSTRGVVGKPPIFVDLVEPHALTTAAHFRELRRKYGYPIVAISLVKQKEKRPHERLLHEQFLKTVRYLNNFMKTGKCIDFISFDVARCNKKGQVLNKLEQIGLRVILKHGWFQSFPVLKSREIRKNFLLENYQPYYSSDKTILLQNGVSRTNCIDCLDRTNVAQFGIGKVALGCQLYAMGYTDEPVIASSSELCRIYEELFDEHGDTLAWQYAGSQLVHSIKTYKKISAFQERSRDVIQTLSRYYSNTFSDYEKQHSINLFLGLYRPYIHGRPHIWEVSSDRHLHFPVSAQPKNNHLKWVQNVNSDSEDDLDEDWFKISLKDMLEEFDEKEPPRIQTSARKRSSSIIPEAEDLYNLAHRTFELTSFDHLLKETVQNKKIVSINDVNQTAFQSTSFMKLWKTPETALEKRSSVKNVEQKNPVPSEDDDEDDDEEAPTSDDDLNFDEDLNIVSNLKNQNFFGQNNIKEPLTISTGLKSMEEAYGFEFKPLSEDDREKFERYVQLANAKLSDGIDFRNTSSINNVFKLTPMFDFKEAKFQNGSSFHIEIPEVSAESLKIYQEVASRSQFEPLGESLRAYEEYR